MLLGNPHFPWETTNGFYQVHLTIPGKLDVMGVSIGGAPGMSISFNKDVAWAQRVSPDRHFTVFELSLDPGAPAVLGRRDRGGQRGDDDDDLGATSGYRAAIVSALTCSDVIEITTTALDSLCRRATWLGWSSQRT